MMVVLVGTPLPPGLHPGKTHFCHEFTFASMFVLNWADAATDSNATTHTLLAIFKAFAPNEVLL